MARRKHRPFDPSAGPWLIRSHYWNAWHCKNRDGGASGYADDIVRAGVFAEDTARTYNDWGRPGGRDEAVPVTVALKDMEARLAKMTAERDDFAVTVDLTRAAMRQQKSRKKGSAPPQPQSGEGGLSSRPQEAVAPVHANFASSEKE